MCCDDKMMMEEASFGMEDPTGVDMFPEDEGPMMEDLPGFEEDPMPPEIDEPEGITDPDVLMPEPDQFEEDFSSEECCEDDGTFFPEPEEDMFFAPEPPEIEESLPEFDFPGMEDEDDLLMPEVDIFPAETGFEDFPAEEDSLSMDELFPELEEVAFAETAVPPAPTGKCDVWRKRANQAMAFYRRTRKRKYLCFYYRYMAAYHRCMFNVTRNRKHICYYYRFTANYLCCMYQVTRRLHYQCQCYLFIARYFKCMYGLTRKRTDLCNYYRFMANYFCCLYKLKKHPVYKKNCDKFMRLYRNCRG